jgi:hypothetical protein
VPLLVHHPALTPRRISAPVSGVDLAPTLLELAGLALPASLDGISLAPWILDPGAGVPPADRVLFSELGTMVSARRGDKKLIRSREPGKSGLAFDLQAGGGREIAPVAAAESWVAGLAAEVEGLLARSSALGDEEAAPGQDEPEFERRLRALGYVHWRREPTTRSSSLLPEDAGEGRPPARLLCAPPETQLTVADGLRRVALFFGCHVLAFDEVLFQEVADHRQRPTWGEGSPLSPISPRGFAAGKSSGVEKPRLSYLSTKLARLILPGICPAPQPGSSRQARQIRSCSGDLAWIGRPVNTARNAAPVESLQPLSSLWPA